MACRTDVARETLVFKILPEDEWAKACRKGSFLGSEIDRRDGYIHLSAAHQVAETARRHFSGQQGLVIVALDTTKIAPALKWEPSRGGDLFPHLYGPLATDAAVWVKPLPLASDGTPQIPGDSFLC